MEPVKLIQWIRTIMVCKKCGAKFWHKIEPFSTDTDDRCRHDSYWVRCWFCREAIIVYFDKVKLRFKRVSNDTR